MNSSIPSLDQLLNALKEINPESIPADSWKVADANDHKLGFLSPAARRLWALREQYRLELADIVQKLHDNEDVFEIDCERHGTNLPSAIGEKYAKDLEALIDAARKPGLKFKILNGVFFSTLRLDFKTPEDKRVFGIRKDFEVVCRDDNSRGDMNSPLDELGKILAPHFVVVGIEAFLIRKSPEASDAPPTSDKPGAKK
ncbi:MAG: hypothetical protein AAB610_00215 [Patescibacteria group bacterium]